MKNLKQWEANGHLYTLPRGDMKTKTYNITFVGEYMCLTTTVSSKNEESAVADATELINEYYAWDLTEVEIIDVQCELLEGDYL